MKHIFLILLVVISIGGFGQKKDLLTKWSNATLAQFDGMTITHTGTSLKQDTIKVLMIVCDTSNYPMDTRLYLRQTDQMLHDGKFVYWQFGYAVYDKTFYVSYLDQNKKPLPKSIVVWMTKEIK